MARNRQAAVSDEARSGGRSAPPRVDAVSSDSSARLGYLIKVVQLRFSENVRAALAPLAIDTREWAALISLDDHRPNSQAEVAKRAGIDRTTMVALLDALENKGLVRRRPDRDDRRKNVVELTPHGRDLRRRAAQLVDDCERRFLATLGETDAQQLKAALQLLIAAGQ